MFHRFFAVGVINTAFGYLIIFFCMYGLGLSPFASNFIGYSSGLTISYILNRRFTFRSKEKTLPEMVAFVAVFLLSYGVNLVFLQLLIDNGTHPALSQIIAGAGYVVIAYLANRTFVFKRAGKGVF